MTDNNGKEEPHPTDLTHKWEDQTLTVEDIVPKVTAYGIQRKVPLTSEEAMSISRQIHRAYKKYHDPSEYAGDFIWEFAGDSLRRVLSVADNLNQRALIVYHYYFYNCVPGDWREKLR